MILLVGVALQVAISVLVPLTMLLPSLFRWDEGKLLRRESTSSWTKQWKVLWGAGCVVACLAFAVEFFVYNASLFTQIKWQVAACLSLVTAWSDFKERIIPNKVVAVSAVEGVAVLVVQVFFNPDIWGGIVFSSALGALVGFLVFFVSRLVTRGGVGSGDIKIYLVLGLLAGFRGVFNIMLYAALAAFFVGIARLTTRKSKLSDTMPLAPFTFVGLALAVAFGA